MVSNFSSQMRFKARESGVFIQSLAGSGEVVSVYAKAINIHVCEYMEVGTSDVLACINTMMYFLEVKQKGEKATPIQVYRMKEWEGAGCTCWLLAGRDQVDAFLRSLDIGDGVCELAPEPEPSCDASR